MVRWSIYLPSLPQLHEELGFTVVDIGCIVSGISFVGFGTAVIQGRMADKYGRVRILQLSCIAQGLGSICMAIFAAGLLSKEYRWIFTLARALCSGMKSGIFMCQA